MTRSPAPLPIRSVYQPELPAPPVFARAAFAVVQGAITRASVTPATTSDAGWAAELSPADFRSFLTSLEPYAGASRIIARAVPAVLGPGASANYPLRSSRSTPTFVGENSEIPVRVYDFDLLPFGPPRKLATVLAWTRELSRRSDAEAIFRRMLAEDMGAGLDAAMFSTAAGSASVHAGLLNGVTPIASSTAAGRTAIEEDLAALAEAVANGGSGAVLFVMSPARLARLRILAPELAAALDIAPSAALAATRIIAVDPLSLLVAVDQDPAIDTSTAATVHMSDTPLPIVADDGTVADPVRSLWQTGGVGFRVIYEMAWAARRTGAVAYADAVAWW